MLKPSPMELLTGVADALEADVLTGMEAGPARDQLRDAISIVRRVARMLPGFPPYLLDDIADLRTTLAELGEDPYGDPALADHPMALDGLVGEDLRLRAVLADVAGSERLNEAGEAHLRRALRRLNEREAALRQSPWER